IPARAAGRRSALAQEHVLRGVRRALEAADLVAGAFELAALGVDPLHRRDPRQDTAAAPGGHLELEPGDIIRGRARGIADGLADHGAAVAVLPVRPGIVPADRFAIDDQ